MIVFIHTLSDVFIQLLFFWNLSGRVGPSSVFSLILISVFIGIYINGFDFLTCSIIIENCTINKKWIHFVDMFVYLYSCFQFINVVSLKLDIYKIICYLTFLLIVAETIILRRFLILKNIRIQKKTELTLKKGDMDTDDTTVKGKYKESKNHLNFVVRITQGLYKFGICLIHIASMIGMYGIFLSLFLTCGENMYFLNLGVGCIIAGLYINGFDFLCCRWIQSKSRSTVNRWIHYLDLIVVVTISIIFLIASFHVNMSFAEVSFIVCYVLVVIAETGVLRTLLISINKSREYFL